MRVLCFYHFALLGLLLLYVWYVCPLSYVYATVFDLPTSNSLNICNINVSHLLLVSLMHIYITHDLLYTYSYSSIISYDTKYIRKQRAVQQEHSTTKQYRLQTAVQSSSTPYCPIPRMQCGEGIQFVTSTQQSRPQYSGSIGFGPA